MNEYVQKGSLDKNIFRGKCNSKNRHLNIRPIAVPFVQLDEWKEVTDNFGTKLWFMRGIMEDYTMVSWKVLSSFIKKIDIYFLGLLPKTVCNKSTFHANFFRIWWMLWLSLDFFIFLFFFKRTSNRNRVFWV